MKKNGQRNRNKAERKEERTKESKIDKMKRGKRIFWPGQRNKTEDRNIATKAARKEI